jgi:hypothetical protein
VCHYDADLNLNALKDTYDYSRFLARLDEYRHFLNDYTRPGLVEPSDAVDDGIVCRSHSLLEYLLRVAPEPPDVEVCDLGRDR